MDDIMVSVLTTAYNHAPYIRQTMDSILAQKTKFRFELLIHDDASTDGTADIIREYAERYPDTIHAILQTENQYSQGKNVYEFFKPITRGKYIAQCEGDDFWCDEYKLQKQVDYMEQHPECVYCFSNSYNVDLESRRISMQTPVKESRVFSSREILAAPEVFLATASTLYPAKLSAELPKELLAGEAGDVPLRNFLMTKGNAYGFADYMVCYRVMTPGSWSDRMRVGKKTVTPAVLQANDAYISYYHAFDTYTDGMYHEELMPKLWKRIVRKIKLERDWSVLKQEPYRSYYAHLPARKRVLLRLEYYFPTQMAQVYRIKNKMQGRE
ncbi:MAG: glycosyltransferase family 2 protein [Butyricicoccus sp.]